MVSIGPFGPGEMLIIIFLILLLILGPSKIPALARSLGEAVREFRRASRETIEPVEEARRQIKEAIRGAPDAGEALRESVDPETLKKLAEKLGVSTEGKSRDEIINEVIKRAKEKGLI